MKPKKKKTISQLKKQADIFFSRYVRYQDSEKVGGVWLGRCITCGQQIEFSRAHAGHFQSRRYSSTRYEEENVNLQCALCNNWHAGEQYKYGLELDLKYGDGTAEKLSKMAQEYHKLTLDELNEIIESSKNAIAFYESL